MDEIEEGENRETLKYWTRKNIRRKLETLERETHSNMN